MRSHILGHDHRFIYFEQKICSKGQIHAIGYLRTALYGKEGFIEPSRLKEILGLEFDSKELPEELRLWNQTEDLVLKKF